MGCQAQNLRYRRGMVTDMPSNPKLTAKGKRTRARIVTAAAQLIYERGVAGTTLEDVKAAAEVSGSQMYHYFADRDALVRAVIDHQADAIVGNQERADLATIDGLRAWRDAVIAHARGTDGKGGCPLGSLGANSPRAMLTRVPRSPPGSGAGQPPSVTGCGPCRQPGISRPRSPRITSP